MRLEGHLHISQLQTFGCNRKGEETSKKMRDEAVSCTVDHITLPGNTNGGKYVIAGTHDFADVGLVKFINDSCC